MTGTAGPSTAPAPGPTAEPGRRDDLLSLGVLAESSMENERRLPIHPLHLDRIDPDLRARMIVERGYASRFPLKPGYVEARVGRVAERDEV